jgi:hypothetical protein
MRAISSRAHGREGRMESARWHVIVLLVALLSVFPASVSVAAPTPSEPLRVYYDPTTGHVTPAPRVGSSPSVQPRRVAQTASVPPGVLDQAQTSFRTTEGFSISATQIVGQVFTAGITGPLTGVRVAVFSCVNWYLEPGYHVVGDLIAEVRALDATGLPTATVLSTATIPGSAVPASYADWVTIAFAQPAIVTTGTQYALILRPTLPNECNFAWSSASSGDVYARGYEVVNFPSSNFPDLWIRHSESDQAFETYVAPQGPVDRIAALKAKVQSLAIKPDVRPGLMAKLDAMLASVSRGNTKATCNQLQAFVNQVRAERTRALTTEQATELLALADSIGAELDCRD